MGGEGAFQTSVFQWVVERHLNPKHELVELIVLAKKIDWAGIARILATYY